ncbi:MAG TPA: glycine C-acetyltransferase [Candidatus Limnocylindrales bacterium]|nr:glycine C-acetyltransferase [Candidatus Limnocylindrales bacterium]
MTTTTPSTASAASASTSPSSGHRDPLGFIADEIAELKARHLYRPLRVMSAAQGPVTTVDGREVISLSSNDYLGLTHHPRLRDAALAAVREYGVGSGAVRTIAGTMTLHEALESDLAEFKHTEAVLTFQSGFTANSGVIPVIATEQDLIVSDALNHASIIDGMRLSKAPRKIFPHKDVAALGEILREATEKGRDDGSGPYRSILVVTDGVFSMDGDIAPLPGIVEAAERYGAAVFVDDAHASGVLGRAGRGTPSHFGLEGRVQVQVGTLSKAVGVLGGYVAGSQALRDLLIQRARPFLFSTSHPPAVAAACREAIKVMQDEPWLIERLWASTKRFKAELTAMGFDTGRSETPITPVIVGEPDAAIRLSNRLFDEGVFATSVVYPTVAMDQSRLRTIVTAALTDEHLDRALDAFRRVGRELGLIAG